MGQPVRIADDLVLDARLTGELEHRSISGQIEYWAHLGAALEPLLQGVQALALLKSKREKPLSVCIDSVDSPQGRRRVAEYLKTVPFPHYEPAAQAGSLVRIEADGTRTVGRFVSRRFVPAS